MLRFAIWLFLFLLPLLLLADQQVMGACRKPLSSCRGEAAMYRQGGGFLSKEAALLDSIQKKQMAWGFYGHQLINRMAVFTLPPEMLSFYKFHIQFITENAVNPDRRRYAVEGEAERHFIDLDVYGDSAYNMPDYWTQALEKYAEDSLRAYGIVPWHVYRVKGWLSQAFRDENVEQILRVSADLGHYIADAQVPLHTTENYNGQLTAQEGIHGFWESRLPELFAPEYDFFVGKAQYISHPQERIWEAVMEAHAAVDSVLLFEQLLTERFKVDKKYSFEERKSLTVKAYSKEFSRAYHQKLAGQVERQMRKAVKMTGDFWYSCWVDAGQPDLWKLLDSSMDEGIILELQEEKIKWEEGEHLMEN